MTFITDKGKEINLTISLLTLKRVSLFLDKKTDFAKSWDLKWNEEILTNHTSMILYLHNQMEQRPDLFSRNVKANLNAVVDFTDEIWNKLIKIYQKDSAVTWPKNNDNIAFLSRLKEKVDDAFDINYQSSLYQLPQILKKIITFEI